MGLNENIWTPSFVMVTSGMASLTLASCIYIIDILEFQKWAKIGVVFGMNAISVYVLADLLAIIFYGLNFGEQSLNSYFFEFFMAIGIAPKVSSMLYALIFVAINFLPAYYLYRKRIFIKL